MTFDLKSLISGDILSQIVQKYIEIGSKIKTKEHLRLILTLFFFKNADCIVNQSISLVLMKKECNNNSLKTLVCYVILISLVLSIFHVIVFAEYCKLV